MHRIRRHHAPTTILASMGLLAAALAAGCGPAENSGGTGGQSSTAASSSTGQVEAACAKDPRVVPYAVGVEATSTDAALTVHFLDASPAPPAKGNNTWTVQLTDSDGKPVNGAAIATKAFMPDHGHGSSIKPTATAKGEDGTYEITPVNLFMPGVWQITFSVEAAGGVKDSAVVMFCVDG